MTAQYIFERDMIVSLGILARTYAAFDPPIRRGSGAVHAGGFNVHAFVVDNRDGEVLAAEYNQIFVTEDPLEHAEQRAIRSAFRRLKEKIPRLAGITVEQYYKTQLFMEPGVSDEAFHTTGCSLYNTFDPCGFCATTLVACYMKRIAYLFEDHKFSAVYDLMKRDYFKGRDSIKQPVTVAENGTGITGAAAELVKGLRAKVHKLESTGIPLVMTLDHCGPELESAATLLADWKDSSLVTMGDELDRNRRTLKDVQRIALGI